MKKVFGLIGFLAVIVSGTAFAQTSQSYDVTVTIPSYLKIRMVDGTGALVSAPDAIAFDYGAAANAGSFTPGTALPRTSTNNWADVEVASNDGGWKVNVSTGTTSGFDWSKVTVDNDDDHVELHRIAFEFDRRHFARLRQLIDTLNRAV